MPATSLAIAYLPLNQGGLGLASATILAPSAYWASWADAIPVLQQQAPEAFAQILQQLQADHTRSHALEAAQRAATAIQNYGWQPPDWQHIADEVAPPRFHHNFEDGVALGRGWQHKAVAVLLVFFVTCEARNNTEKISMTQEWNAWREHKSRSVKDGKRHAQIRSVLLRSHFGSSLKKE